MTEQTKYVLEETRLPKSWYNIQADLPRALPPVLHQDFGRLVSSSTYLVCSVIRLLPSVLRPALAPPALQFTLTQPRWRATRVEIAVF